MATTDSAAAGTTSGAVTFGQPGEVRPRRPVSDARHHEQPDRLQGTEEAERDAGNQRGKHKRLQPDDERLLQRVGSKARAARRPS